MKFGIVFLANEGYAASPERLRAKYKPFWSHYHVEICPSNPEGLALIGREQARVLRAFERRRCHVVLAVRSGRLLLREVHALGW